MYLKSHSKAGLLHPTRYQIDLSNNALNIDFGQKAANISEVKVEGQEKKIANSARFNIDASRPG